MKYINIKTNDSGIIATLRSIFSIEELENLLVGPQYNTTQDSIKMLDKYVYRYSTMNTNQVTIFNKSKNSRYYIYYNHQKDGISSKLIRVGITGTNKDFIRAIIRDTSSEFKRMFYTLLSDRVRNWLTDTLHINIHCDYYEFIGHGGFFKIFMARSDFHGEIDFRLRPVVKFDVRKESVEDIAKKINEIFRIIKTQGKN